MNHLWHDRKLKTRLPKQSVIPNCSVSNVLICTSVYHMQYHLTSEQHSFNNLTFVCEGLIHQREQGLFSSLSFILHKINPASALTLTACYSSIPQFTHNDHIQPNEEIAITLINLRLHWDNTCRRARPSARTWNPIYFCSHSNLLNSSTDWQTNHLNVRAIITLTQVLLELRPTNTVWLIK